MLLYAFILTSADDEFVMVTFRDGGMATSLPLNFLNVNGIPNLTMSGGATCTAATEIDFGGTSHLLLEFSAGGLVGQTLFWPQWVEQVRGINGQWFAPFEMEVQPE